MMTTTTRPQTTQSAWAPAVTRVGQEFPLTPLPVLSGQIPEGLRGTLYRNGPARLQRGGEWVGHWFDGDGAILAVHFTDAGASGIYRFVQTKGYIEESQAGKFLYSNYGMKPPGPIWDFWIKAIKETTPIKNTANTSAIALPDKLLALWEGGSPHALDLETLDTFGKEDLGGLESKQPYTAHPKLDPQTGEIFAFGISVGSKPQLNIYKSDRTGKIIQKAAFEIENVSVVHSFVLTQQYLVFFIPPLKLDSLSMFIGLKTYANALEWKPQKGTQIVVVDRDTLQVVSRGETEPFFQWHFGNGYEDADGSVVLDLVRFADFPQTNEYLREMASGETHTAAYGTLWKARLNPQTAKVIEMQQVCDRPCEFPAIPPHQVGQPWRYTYLALQRRGTDISKEWFKAIARFDYETGTLTEADLGENRYVVEPIYARDRQDGDRGWILTVVYDATKDASEVWVFDSDRLDDEPVCRLGLPEVIPIGFHGTWNAAIAIS